MLPAEFTSTLENFPNPVVDEQCMTILVDIVLKKNLKSHT